MTTTKTNPARSAAARLIDSALPGAFVAIKGYQTADGRVVDYLVETDCYLSTLEAAYQKLQQMESADIAAELDLSVSMVRNVKSAMLEGLLRRVRRMRDNGETARLTGGELLFGKVLSRSDLGERSSKRRSGGMSTVIRAHIERELEMDGFRTFKLSSSWELIRVDGKEVRAADAEPERFDPYAFGLAKVSSEEGPGSW